MSDFRSTYGREAHPDGLRVMTDRWGDPLGNSDEVPKELVDAMVDGFTFVAELGGKQGILFEFEIMHADGEDPWEQVGEAWGGLPSSELSAEAVMDRLCDRAEDLLRILGKESGADVWVTVGPHVFNGRAAFCIWVPQESLHFQDTRAVMEAWKQSDEVSINPLWQMTGSRRP